MHTSGSFRTQFESIARRIPDFAVTPHLLRHTYLTNLFDQGLDVKEVQYLAGHTSPEITMRIYVHYRVEQRRQETFDKVCAMG